tara:strand:+ start:337 stop:1347 length:1011 start_codon:yes stop_codon:yes gene_type:complete
MIKTKQIFIVGSSRSGTTMMGRILGLNSNVFTFRELHFFGKLWTNNSNQKLIRKDQIDLLSRLLCIQKNGIFNQNNYSEFNSKSSQLLNSEVNNPLEIYRFFLERITEENNAKIACEQTPQNLYYIEEILQFFPDSKVINLIRDQRDVLFSQKNKWKRRFLGAKSIPFFEVLRSYINYHPILTSRVWNSSMSWTMKYIHHPRVKIVKFEDLLNNPENIVKDICNFLAIDFKHEMLEVPIIGSSLENDSKSILMIDNSKINRWKSGGLSDSEIYLSQKFSSTMMDEFGYEKKKFRIPPLSVIFYLISFIFKFVLAFLFNIHRMGNIKEIIRKRFFIK